MGVRVGMTFWFSVLLFISCGFLDGSGDSGGVCDTG